MRKYKYLLSIPVHEKPEVIIDLLCNIQHYWQDDYVVVLHVSKGFNWNSWYLTQENFYKIIESLGNVYVNPRRLDTRWGGIIQTHMANFKFAERNLDFDYFVLVASNELFIRNDTKDWIGDKEFGCQTGRLMSNIDENWCWTEKIKKDLCVHHLRENEGIKEVYFSAPEGTFYKKNLMHDICELIDKYYDFSPEEELYPREEVYFSTLAIHLCGVDNARNRHYSSMGLDISTANDVYEKCSEIYSIKPVKRDIYDEMRIWLRQYYNGGYYDNVKKYLPFIAKIDLNNL